MNIKWDVSNELSMVEALIKKETGGDIAILTVCEFDESNPELVPWDIEDASDRSRFMDWHDAPHLVARAVVVDDILSFTGDDLVDGWQWYISIVDGVAHDVWTVELDGRCPDYMGGDIEGASEWANKIDVR